MQLTKTIILISVIFTTVLFAKESHAKEWYFVYDYCAGCDSNGEKSRNSNGVRLMISNPIYAGEYDHACLGGAFYDEIGNSGSPGMGYSSESQARKAIKDTIRRHKNNSSDSKVTQVYLDKHCD